MAGGESTLRAIVIVSLPTTPAQALALVTSGLVALLAIGLLTLRILLQVVGEGRTSWVSRLIDVAVLPLLAGFALILYTRLQEIMPLG